MTPTVTVHAYEPDAGDYCGRCGLPERNRRHKVADAPLASVYDLPGDAALVDEAIRAMLATRETFSANQMRPWLDRLKNGKAVAGPRIARWKRLGYLVEVGHEKSLHGKTKGKVVAVYAAGPNWKPGTPAVQGK